MNSVFNAALGVIFSATVVSANPSGAQEREHWLRVQIALDDLCFRPGAIDGKWGEFTAKALDRYLRSQGKQSPVFGEQPPTELDLPLSSDKSPLSTHQISSADEAIVGKVATRPRAQAKLRLLQYGSVIEAVAEKFHATVELLRELNPEARWRAGECVKVPAVAEPFDLAAVSELKKAVAEQMRAGERNAIGEKTKRAAEESASPNSKAGQITMAPLAVETIEIIIDTTEKILELHKGDRLSASYPITPGSERLPAPQGEWLIERITWLPPFRWDKQMLTKGRRSSHAFNLPPGPNSPVGIVWVAINRDGIGIHGTSEPETIGRSASHGCIRLSNWDAFDLGRRVHANTKVTIR